MSDDRPTLKAALADAEKEISGRLDAGLDRAGLLTPGHGTFELKAGTTQAGVFARAEAAARLTTGMEAMGFAEVRKTFDASPAEFMAGIGLRGRF